MRYTRYAIAVCLALVFLCSVMVSTSFSGDTVGQVLAGYVDIIKANPMPAGEQSQAVKVAEDETATVLIGRFAPGATVKPHFHKTHAETVYVIEGNGRMEFDGKRFDIRPGTVHFNAVNRVHAVANTGSTDMIVLQVFTPAWKTPDRVFVP